ncbi:MAG TPA: PilC/PilY family type IV pilus protein [Woeseiaceae bacterium]|nr:PilC/PilY family type IV pilus protein [Woeseiaceae bacterium]
MITTFRKTGTLCAGILVALACGTPAVADDTELLLINPDDLTAPKPNIMFILDTSGSMTTVEKTREIYNSATVFTGTCNSDMLYWTEVDVQPSCDVANTRFIDKTAFVCAAGQMQLSGIGSYTNTMAQFRDGGSGWFSIVLGTDQERWQQLEPGNPTAIVECRADRGRHGDGDATLVYAQKGGDPSAPFTAEADAEISWGSWPASQTITVYDGNYLNYLQNPVTVDRSRINIVRDVTKTVLNSVSGINVGLMRFNNDRGGPVILGMTDLDANRATVNAKLDSLTAAGATPLSETLYESARYWRGLPAYYGENVNEHATDPNALVQVSPEVYRQPPSDACSKNFNVLLTDGAPNQDFETPTLVAGLPGWSTIMGAGCDGTGQGSCLDDVGQYLYTGDISSTDAGAQIVTTHTIGFAVDLPILKETADDSGGEYFLANDVESLTLALLQIVASISDRSLSFAAPAVAVNTFNRTQNLNDLYLTTFAASQNLHWPGNLKKYRIADGNIVDRNGADAVDPSTGYFKDTASSYWTIGTDGNDVEAGGAANRLPDPAVRRLFTNLAGNDLTAAANALSPANEAAFTLTDLGLTGSAEEPTKEQLIRWARGEDLLDEDSDPATTVRNAMGDPLHSQPAAVVYGGTEGSPDVVVFTATNDGYVHAIDGTTGQELWAFVPREHLPNLVKLFFNPESQFKNYGVDGDIIPVVADRDRDGQIEPGDGDFVRIIFGMRRGGDSYYALDVTNRNAPRVMWRFSSPELGQSWSPATVARVKIASAGQNADEAVVIIGGGYDNVHDTLAHPAAADTDGAGVYMLDLESGAVLWRAGRDLAANLQLTSLTRSIPTQVRVIDLSGDGYADRMYAADMGGQILRFDIANGAIANNLVAGGVIAQLGAEGNAVGDADTRRFYNSPDVSIFNDSIQNRRFIAISIGSGYRAHPLDTTVNDRFYSIRDRDIFNPLTQAEYNSYDIVKDADLVEVSGQVGTAITAADRGWKFTLPANQMVLATSVTFNNEIFFTAFSPDNAAAATCAAGRGQNFLYRMTVTNGDPIADLDGIVAGEEDQARVTGLAQGGIAPSPRFLFPSPDDPDCEGQECAPPPIGCIGVECFDPGFENVPVRTLWTADGIE